jgi:hypothetical protein
VRSETPSEVAQQEFNSTMTPLTAATIPHTTATGRPTWRTPTLLSDASDASPSAALLSSSKDAAAAATGSALLRLSGPSPGLPALCGR